MTLTFLELGVTLFLPQDLSGAWRVYSPRGYMLNKAGGSARHQLGSRVVTYRFNELHLRGGPPDVSAKRILCLGDSFTFGWLLNEPDTFVEQLNLRAHAELPIKVQFLNGGAGGWGTAQYLAFLEEFGEEIHPAAVLVFLNADDIARSMDTRLYTFSGDLRTLEPVVPHRRGTQLHGLVRSLPAYQWLLEHSQLIQLIRHAMRRVVTPDSAHGPGPASGTTAAPNMSPTAPDVGLAVDMAQALFLRIKRWCDNHRTPFFVVNTGCYWANQPSKSMPMLGRERRAQNLAFLRQAEHFFKTNDIPFEDLTDGLLRESHNDSNSIIIKGDGHPDERGSRLIGELTWRWLRPRLLNTKWETNSLRSSTK